MRIECLSADIRAVKADMVVVSLFEGAKRPSGGAAAVDTAIGGGIAAALRDGDFAGPSRCVRLPCCFPDTLPCL